MIIIDDCPLEVHPSQIAKILAATTKLVILPKIYKDFEDVFLIKNAS